MVQITNPQIEELDRNVGDFHKATFKGVWSWEVYPDAVVYLAKEKVDKI